MTTEVIRNETDLNRAIQQVRRFYGRVVTQGGKRLSVKIGVFQPPRTTSQNNTVHMWFGEFAEQTGATPDEIKRALKHQLLPKVERVILGRRYMVPMSTADLSKTQMIEFMERVQQIAVEYDVVLTQPDPKHWARWRQEAEQERRAA